MNRKRYMLWILWFVVILQLNGCVIKRLLEFKRQMSQPEQHIHFRHAGILVLKKPVLKLEDLELLTGIHPTRISKNKVRYEFNRPEAPQHSLIYTLVFKDDVLAVIDYPDVFYNAVESSFAFDSLQLFGTADLPENGQWQVNNQGPALSGIPTREEIVEILGAPTSMTNFPTMELYHYHYEHPSIHGMQHIRVTLSFHKASHGIVAIDLVLPDREWGINL